MSRRVENVRLLILGAGGFAKEVADVVLRTGHEIAGFFEEQPSRRGRPPHDAPLLGKIPDLGFDGIVVGVGDSALRRRFYDAYAGGHECPSLVDPSAVVSRFARIGVGSLVMQGCVVSADVVVGRNVLLNVGCYVAHDCGVGDHAHLAASVMLGGGSRIGTGAFCGTSAVVLPDICIGAWAVCGAGAVVTRDIPDGAVARGVPARVVGMLDEE
jgi:sugar O-acyltransferase (sialic acid O-acetyltransferase NeuD family)